MAGWVIWLVVAAAFGIGELHTGALYLAPFAAGGLVATLASAAGAPFAVAGVLFLVGTAASFGLLRPLARRHRTLPPAIRTGAAALIGRPAVVLERIANNEGSGCVRIDGEVWTARSFDEDVVIEEGERVEVVAIRGATALVMRSRGLR